MGSAVYEVVYVASDSNAHRLHLAFLRSDGQTLGLIGTLSNSVPSITMN